MTTALATLDTNGVKVQTLTITDRADAMTVIDAGSYEDGGVFLVDVKAVQKRVGDLLDGPISDAHKAHKSAVAAKNELVVPLKHAEVTVKNKMITWKRAEEARQAEERRRLEAEERQREEDRRLAEAERLEAQGRDEEAGQVIDAPVVVAPIVMPSAAPKIAGVSTRKAWKGRVIDATKLPFAYLMPNEKAINATVRAMGGATSIPGVEVYQEDVMAVGTG